MATFYIGELVRVKAIFSVPTGIADPDAVFFEYRHEDSIATSLEHGVHPELVRVATGQFYVDINVNNGGEWYWRWESTGDGQAAEEGSFTAEATLFP